jgi:hypothetical protein
MPSNVIFMGAILAADSNGKILMHLSFFFSRVKIVIKRLPLFWSKLFLYLSAICVDSSLSIFAHNNLYIYIIVWSKSWHNFDEQNWMASGDGGKVFGDKFLFLGTKSFRAENSAVIKNSWHIEMAFLLFAIYLCLVFTDYTGTYAPLRRHYLPFHATINKFWGIF